ncbi:MAG: CoB--CoM heterodisulfide reductase iron-sulfur subunit B family protein [Candidatus Latescibacterota bacterium]
MELSYFPGCSLHSTAREYDESTRAVCAALGIGLKELADWNCCGSTSAHSVNAELARRLPARNLEIAARAGLDLMMPCAACYSRMKTAQAELPESGDAASARGIRVSHILEVFAGDGVLERLSAKVTRRLEGLQVACYYGCLTTRPPRVTGATDYEYPESMDRLLEAAGAAALPWSYKTDCCGASLTLTRPDVVLRLVDQLLLMAAEAGADCIAVACSMCQANLDARQGEAASRFGRAYRLPVLYVSELLALAMGLPGAQRWWRRHLTDPRPLLGQKGLA